MSKGNENQEGVTSDSLHNHNCYAYLNALVISESVLENLKTHSPDLVSKLNEIRGSVYKPDYPYADLYTQFFTITEKNIEDIYDKKRKKSGLDIEQIENYLPQLEDGSMHPATLLILRGTYSEQLKNNTSLKEVLEAQKNELTKQLSDLDQFIYSIYDNKNEILEYTFTKIQTIPLGHTPSDDEIEEELTNFLKDSGERVNKASQSPAQAGSAFGRFIAMISNNFKPQHTTSLATRRVYEHNKNWHPLELRMGTQAQRDNGIVRISPLFLRWLDVQARLYPKADPLKPITHVYINNLGFDRTDTEGSKERALTSALHKLDDDLENIAVITLPADTGLMQKSDFKKMQDSHNYQEVYNEFLQIANQDPRAKRKVKDFYLSDKVRKLVFQDQTTHYSNEIEQDQLKELLNKSFDALGIKENSPLSSSQRQAVWFHFIKYELTNRIIEKLEPHSLNFSCKDAIDRGGVSSAYYNLMKSFEQNTPMSREEFERALHAAPSMVKARGMNHHLKVIWNTVDAYIEANYDSIKADENKEWLIEWRDSNCPHVRVDELLAKRIFKVKNELNAMVAKNPDQAKAIQVGKEIIANIEQQSQLGVSGKRLLLETVSLTPRLITNPTKEDNAKRYAQLADKLTIKYPAFKVLGGLMKSLVGIVLFLPLFGHTKDWISEGFSTAKAGYDSETRKKILSKMKEQIRDMKASGNLIENDEQHPGSETPQVRTSS